MWGGGKDIRPRSGRMGHGLHGTGMAMVGKIRRNSPFIAPRLKRQDRLFSKGLSDPPHGGTIMSKWCGNENCLLCVDNEPDPYVRLLREDYDALRAENARLRKAMQSAYDYITNHRHGKAKAMLFDGLELYRQAALQPKEPKS